MSKLKQLKPSDLFYELLESPMELICTKTGRVMEKCGLRFIKYSEMFSTKNINKTINLSDYALFKEDYFKFVSK